MKIDFEVPGEAVPQGSMKPVRMGKHLGVQPNNKAALYEWRSRVSFAGAEAMKMRDLLEGPVEIVATFVLPRPKSHYGTGRNAAILKPSAPRRFVVKTPDLSKLLRALEDALTGIVWHDDAQVAHAVVTKEYVTGGVGPRTIVTVRTLADAAAAEREAVSV